MTFFSCAAQYLLYSCNARFSPLWHLHPSGLLVHRARARLILHSSIYRSELCLLPAEYLHLDSRYVYWLIHNERALHVLGCVMDGKVSQISKAVLRFPLAFLCRNTQGRYSRHALLLPFNGLITLTSS